jgi:phospholipase/carboxylesterase
MTTKKLSLHHLIQFPASDERRNQSSLYPAILALHGRGSNERDLIELASHLLDGLLWICPRAPLLLGTDAYEWFRVRVIGKPDPEQVMFALETIDHFVDEILAAYPADPRRVFLLGFSQGSLLSMCYTLTHPERVAGVIAQSGYIPNSVELEIQEAGLKNKPFLLTHGEQDTLIPVEWGRRSRDRLRQLGVDLEYHEFPIGHSVSIESLAVLRRWLERKLVP